MNKRLRLFIQLEVSRQRRLPMRKRVGLLTGLIAIILILGIFYSEKALAYGVETHAGLTKEIFQFYNKHSAVNKIPDSFKNYLIEGSRQEDMPPRWMNHYYDPVYDRGLTSNLYGDWDKSKTWAQAIDEQNKLIYKTPVFIASVLTAIQERKISALTSETNFTWQRAIEFYLNNEKEKAFYALGHILHLIEDASVPDHTRNDPHPALNHEDSLGTGSPYELWTEQFTAENIDLSKNLANKTPVLLSDLNVYFDSIANYSNNNFYSKDTIGLGEYKTPEPDYFGRDGIYFYGFKKESDGDYHLLRQDVAKKFTSWAFQNKNQLFLTDPNQDLILQDYWSRLSTKAVQHGAGVIDLFFKEVEKAKNNQSAAAAEEKPKSFFATILDAINPGDNFQPVAEISLDGNQPDDYQYKEVPLPKEEGLPTVETVATIQSSAPLTQTVSQSQSQPQPAPQQICSFDTTQSPLKEKIIINEVAWMGTTNSANDEWIELKNISGGELSIGGWQVIDRGEQIKIIFDINAKIPANGFYLLERTDDATVPNIKADVIYSGALSNTAEGLRFFNNQCNLIDEVLANPEWSAGNNSEKKTLERDVNGFGWHTSSQINGTPKAENTQPANTGGSGGSASNLLTSDVNNSLSQNQPQENTSTPPTASLLQLPNHIVISEVLFDVEGTDAGKEFIELYNPTDQIIDISTWSIQHLSGGGSLIKKNFEAGNVIQPKSFFLIWLGDDARADMKWQSGSLNNTGATVILANNAEPVATSSPSNVVDRLAYGSGTQIMPEMAAMQLTGIIPGQSLERKAWQNNSCVSSQSNGEFFGNSCDTDNNSFDFEIRSIVNPQNSQSLPEPRQAPTAVQNLNAEYNSTTLAVVLNWDSSQDFQSATSTLNYQIASRNSPLIMLGGTTSTYYVYGFNEIGKDYNFEVRAVDKDGLASAPATLTLNAPSFLSNIYFYRDPSASSSSNNYLLDLNWTDYPFIKKYLADGGPSDGWKLAVFYLNKEPEAIPYFFSDQQYHPTGDPAIDYGQWGTTIPGALKIKYGACTGSTFISTSLILPNSPANCSVNYGGYRNLTMSWGYFNEDPHLLLNFDSSQFSQSLTGQDYITAAFYSYSGFNTQTLVAIDKTKYFFSENVPFHQPPRMNGEINLNFNPVNPLVYVNWPAATDPDTPDSALTYEIKYSDSGDWYGLGTQNSAVKFVRPGDTFNVSVRAKDDFGNYSEEYTALFNSADFNSAELPLLVSSLTCDDDNNHFSNKLAFKYGSAADDEIINRIKLSQRYYDPNQPIAGVKVYSYVDDNNPEAGTLLGVSNEISAISFYPVYQEYNYDFPEVRLGAKGSAVWFVVENAAGGSTLETKVCKPGDGILLGYAGSWFRWFDSGYRQFWHQIYYAPSSEAR